jgi:hypothetical protein
MHRAEPAKRACANGHHQSVDPAQAKLAWDTAKMFFSGQNHQCDDQHEMNADPAMLIESMNAPKEILEATVTRTVKKKIDIK